MPRNVGRAFYFIVSLALAGLAFQASGVRLRLPGIWGESLILAQGRLVWVAPAQGRNVDQLFIDMMVPHSLSEIEMAQVARERGTSQLVIDLADELIASRQSSVASLLSWREAWYGSRITPPTTHTPVLVALPASGQPELTVVNWQAEVQKLRATGSGFDVIFVDALITHQEEALQAAELVLKNGEHAELRRLARRIVSRNHQQIEELRLWLEVWTGRTES